MRLITFIQVLAICVLTAGVHGQGPGGGFGPPGFGPMGGPDTPIVKDYDTNKDGWLNRTERKAARQFVQQNRSTAGRGFGRGPGGRGGFGGGGAMEPAEKGVTILPDDVRTYPKAPFYDESVLRTLFLTFDDTDWEKELEDFHGTDVDVAATMQVDGRSYRDVGVRFRGASSYMSVPEGRKRSLNLTLDMAHDGQAVSGYRTLNLLNSHGDPTFLRAVLYLHIAQQFIPAPKANFVRVVINGENWGVYASIQQFNKDFVREHFKKDDGARWKVPGSPNGRGGLEYLGDDATQYKRIYEIKTKDAPAEWDALIKMTKVLNETPPEQLEKALSPLLNIDNVLRFLALDNALVNNDGYWTRASDYSLYRGPDGRFHVTPHDTNESFPTGRGGPGGPGGGRGGPRGQPPPGAPPLGPPPPGFGPPGGRGFGGPGGGGTDLDPLIGLDDMRKPLRSKLLAVPALRERYLGYVREIATKWLDWSTLGPVAKRYQTLIEDEVKRDTKKLDATEAFAEGIDGSSRSLKAFAEARRARLLQ